MSGLYLEDGETFVVTTHRISVDFTLYDLMLTSKNLILFDSSQTTINLQKISLSTVLAVNAGKTATEEPVITLTFVKNQGGDGSLPMNLVFSQNAGEQRKAERDDWIKRFMEQVVAIKQGSLLSGSRPGGTEPGTMARPSATMRGIDMPLPHKSVIRDEPELVRLRVIPEESYKNVTKLMPIGISERYEGKEKEALGEKSQYGSPETIVPVQTVAPEEKNATDMRVDSEEETPGTKLSEKEGTATTQQEQATLQEQGEEPVPVPEETSSELQPLVSESSLEMEEHEQLTNPESVQVAGSETTKLSPDRPEEPKSAERMPQGESEPAPQIRPKTFPVSWPATPPEISREILEEITRETVSEDFRSPSRDTSMGNVTSEKYRKEKPPISLPSPKTLVAMAIIIIVILAIAGGVIYDNRFIPGSAADTPPSDSAATNVTSQSPVLTPTPVIVPQEGIWLLVNGSFSGDYGKPGNLIPVVGSGQSVYPIRAGTPLLQAIFLNQDNSGKMLLVEVYSNGTQVLSRETSAPGGTIEFIIDPITGEFPRATPTPTSWTGLSPGVTYRT